jgi:AhpD family alkylhydroperoxidase
MYGLQNTVNSSGLERPLLEPVKMRASQINGCAYCLDLHSKDAGAALEWTEALTLIGEGHVPDAVYASAREHFSEEELVNLALAVVAINGWNRFSIAFRAEAGNYRPGMHERTKAA